MVVVNGDPRAPLTMLSLSSDLDDFHCSWFKDAIVPPGGNTSFTVVYLARSVGHLEGSITLSTSAGDVHFEVSAVGLRLRLGLRLGLGMHTCK